MTRKEAFELMQAGKKVTHRHFTRDEYCHMPGLPNIWIIYGEDGCDLSNHFHKTDFLAEGWREFK